MGTPIFVSDVKPQHDLMADSVKTILKLKA
jgi:hypothetical protein